MLRDKATNEGTLFRHGARRRERYRALPQPVLHEGRADDEARCRLFHHARLIGISLLSWPRRCRHFSRYLALAAGP